MFGNLSKSLIKAPNYFNANVDSEPNQYSKIDFLGLFLNIG